MRFPLVFAAAVAAVAGGYAITHWAGVRAGFKTPAVLSPPPQPQSQLQKLPLKI